MAIEAQLTLDGYLDLVRQLEALGDTAERLKLTKSAVRAGSKVLRQGWAEVAERHRVSGNLEKSIVASIKVYGGDTPVAVIGAAKSVAPHAHIVEFGSVERFHKPFSKRGRFGRKFVGRQWTGRAPALGVFRRYWEAHRDRVLAVMAKSLAAGLDRLARKAARAARKQARAAGRGVT